jgi:hypothetical protein
MTLGNAARVRLIVRCMTGTARRGEGLAQRRRSASRASRALPLERRRAETLCIGKPAQQRDALAEFLDIAAVDIGFESLDGFQQSEPAPATPGWARTRWWPALFPV